jgi:MoaA/NifB/PqqE/SkfB family radical SAM enzyme
LVNVKKISLSKVGEALASKHFRHLFGQIKPIQYPNLEIDLISNCLLVSKKTWDSLGELAGCIKYMTLSIDGATPETLEKLRRGLKWERLQSALEFVRDLRRSLKLKHLNVNFILQRDNFRELPDMIDLCSVYHVDDLRVERINAHGSYTNDEFRDVDIADPSHRLYSECLAVIEQSKIKHKEMLADSKSLLPEKRSVPGFYITI